MKLRSGNLRPRRRKPDKFSLGRPLPLSENPENIKRVDKFRLLIRLKVNSILEREPKKVEHTICYSFGITFSCLFDNFKTRKKLHLDIPYYLV